MSTQQLLEDERNSEHMWQQVGCSQFTPPHILDSALDPELIMKGIWKEVCPRIHRMVGVCEPLPFKLEGTTGKPGSEGVKAWT